MDLSKISNAEILSRFERLAQSERKITHLILWHILEAQQRLLFAELGYSNMHEYLVKHLKYADDAAYRRLRAANVLKQVPQAAVKLEEGSLNLTQLTQVQQCIRHEKKAGKTVDAEQTSQILAQIENKNSYETKKTLAVEFNFPIHSHETITPQRDDTVRLEVSFTQEQMETLRRAKELLSHTLPDGNWADLFTHLAGKHVQKVLGKEFSKSKNEPNRTIESLASTIMTTDAPQASTQRFSATQISHLQKRKYTTRATKRVLLKKAHYRCEYVDESTGQRCTATHYLDIDHRIPFALGGKDSIENLRILCRNHNQLSARKWGLARQ